MAIRIGINGFGRIGRLVYRIGDGTGGFEVVGVNDLVPADNLAYLAASTTRCTAGSSKDVQARRQRERLSFTVDGEVTETASKDPAQASLEGSGACHYVLESTGLFTDYDDATSTSPRAQARADLGADQDPRRRADLVLQGQPREVRPGEAHWSSRTRAARPTAWRRSPR
jgi:glyceraldehyde 3-phosphate dehydrogenase